MKLTFIFVICLGAVVSLSAGTISGTVKAVAPEVPKAKGGGDDGYDRRSLKLEEKVDYDHLTDFVVYIEKIAAAPTAAPTVAGPTIQQKDASFVPHVLPVAVGTTVLWPNLDPIYHNVFSTSDAKSFNLGFYTTEKTQSVTFDKTGRVDVFCAIHTKMHCIVLVVPNSFFALADASTGRYSIKDVPPGTYTVIAWHERLPVQKRVSIVVTADGTTKLDFTMSVTGSP